MSDFIDLITNINNNILKSASGLGPRFDISDYNVDDLKKIVAPLNQKGEKQVDVEIELLAVTDLSNAFVRASRQLKKTPQDYYDEDEIVSKSRLNNNNSFVDKYMAKKRII